MLNLRVTDYMQIVIEFKHKSEYIQNLLKELVNSGRPGALLLWKKSFPETAIDGTPWSFYFKSPPLDFFNILCPFLHCLLYKT